MIRTARVVRAGMAPMVATRAAALALAAGLALIGCSPSPGSAPLPPPEGGLEYIADGRLVTGGVEHPLDVAGPVLVAARHGDHLVLATPRALVAIGAGGERVHLDLAEPVGVSQLASAPAGVAVAVTSVAGRLDRTTRVLWYDGGEVAELWSSTGRVLLAGVSGEGPVVLANQELHTLGAGRPATPLGVNADQAWVFAGADAALVARDERILLVDLDTGSDLRVDGLPGTAVAAQAVAAPDGRRLAVLLVSRSELDEDHQRTSLGLWTVTATGQARRVTDLANDDALGGFGTAPDQVYVVRYESGPHGEVARIDLDDGSAVTVDLPASAVPVCWPLPLLSLFGRDG